jgi:hypothetical protein
MSVIIRSNGSKWAGEKPDNLQALEKRLKKHPVADFTGVYGLQRGLAKVKYPSWQIVGNFKTVSAVFNVYTDEPKVYRKLKGLIYRNKRQQREAVK